MGGRLRGTAQQLASGAASEAELNSERTKASHPFHNKFKPRATMHTIKKHELYCWRARRFELVIWIKRYGGSGFVGHCGASPSPKPGACCSLTLRFLRLELSKDQAICSRAHLDTATEISADGGLATQRPRQLVAGSARLLPRRWKAMLAL